MIDVSGALKNPGNLFEFTEALTFEPSEVMGEELRFEDALLEGEFFGAEETVGIKARLTVKVEAHCSRCLEPVEYPMDVEVEAEFTRSEEEDSYPLVGHTIDAKDAAFEALLLELPLRFVCSDDCKGLCPVCGKNRNISSCNCLEGAVKQNAFSALSSLLSNQNNEEV